MRTLKMLLICICFLCSYGAIPAQTNFSLLFSALTVTAPPALARILTDIEQISKTEDVSIASSAMKAVTMGGSGFHAEATDSALCREWNLASDFRWSPNQENPNRDSCGNLNVWHFMQSTELNRDPQTYSLLPYFTTRSSGVQGLEKWTGSDFTYDPAPDGLPEFVMNTTGVTQDIGYEMPPDVINAHPGIQQLAIVGWRSPISGSVSITGFVNDLNASCGNGILWAIDKGTTNLAEGSILNGESQEFRNGTGGDSLAAVPINEGDFIYFVIDPNYEHVCDSTELSISIALNAEPFTYFAPQAVMNLGPKAADDSFEMTGIFVLGAKSDGIDPMNEDVTVKLGAFFITIPAGSFRQAGRGTYRFDGTVNEVALRVLISSQQYRGNGQRQGSKKPQHWWFSAYAKHANLDNSVVPVKAQITIGNDQGQATLNSGKARFGVGDDEIE